MSSYTECAKEEYQINKYGYSMDEHDESNICNKSKRVTYWLQLQWMILTMICFLIHMKIWYKDPNEFKNGAHNRQYRYNISSPFDVHQKQKFLQQCYCHYFQNFNNYKNRQIFNSI